MKIQVNHWLDDHNRDYNTGVQLYASLSPNPIFLKIFNAGKSSYSTKKLYELLCKFRTETPAQKTIAIPKTKAQNKMPEIVSNTYKRALMLFKESGRLHAQLSLMATDADRLKASLNILDNMEEARRCFDFYDYYIETGEMLAIETKEQPNYALMSRAELINEKRKLIVQRSKLKAKIIASPGKRTSKWTDQLINTDTSIDTISKLLNEPII